MMQDFITGLQFLTRIQIFRQTEWSPESFGRSVKYFPLVGAVLGAVLAAIGYGLCMLPLLVGIQLPGHVFSALLLIATVVLSGGLHCDGFMDTMDGIFSGRSRERMLEIMKDSRVGANGVVAFLLLMLLKWSLITDIRAESLLPALFLMPVLGRLALVMTITLFPYARPDGIGKAFAVYATKRSLLIAFVFASLCAIPAGLHGAAALSAAIVVGYLAARYIANLLGGVTGDVYGAVSELAELAVLFVFLLIQ